MKSHYDAGIETEFEPGSRGRVLRNMLGIQRVDDMDMAESRALDAAQVWAAGNFDSGHRFTAEDIQEMHRRWLGGIYVWAGEYRSVNISRGGFMFAAAAQVPKLMREFERNVLAHDTPCKAMDHRQLAAALARTHTELVTADCNVTHRAGVKVDHLGEDGGFGTAHADSGASSGDTGIEAPGPEHPRDCAGDWPVARDGAAASGRSGQSGPIRAA